MVAGESDERSILAHPQIYIVFGVTLIVVMGVASITAALPLIAEQFGVPKSRAGELITFFFLPGVFLTPVFGLLADRLGRQRVLVPGLLVFAAGSIGCAFAPSFEVLLGLRFVQGLGAASAGPINLAVIGDLFDGDARTAAMGYNATVMGGGTAVYPFAGGALAEWAWYLPFFIPVLAIPVAGAVFWGLEVPETGSTLESDPESLLETLTGNWAAFGALFLSFAIFLVLFGPYLNYFPIMVEDRLGFSALEIGALMSSVSLTGAGAAALVGRLSSRFELTSMLAVGFGGYAASLAGLAVADSLLAILLAAMVYGLSQGLSIPTSQSLIARIAPDHVRGSYMALNTTMYRIAQTTAPLAAAFVHTSFSIGAVYYAGAGFAGVVGLGLIVAGRSERAVGERV